MKIEYAETKIKKIHEFIDTLFESTDYIALTCYPETKEQRIQKLRAVNVAGLRDDIKKKYLNEKFLTSQAKKEYSVCISPNPIKLNKTRSTANVKNINYLYVDVDEHELNLDKIEPKPSIITKRKNNKLHLYWAVNSVKNSKKTQKDFYDLEVALIELVGGDKAVKDPSRPLRLPYTYHLKDTSDISEYKIIKSEKHRYNFEDLKKDLIKNKKKKKEEKKDPAFANSDKDIITFLKQSYSSKGAVNQGDGRSLELFHVGTDCFKWGLKEKQAMSLATWFNEKLCEPPEADSILKHQIKSAYKYTKDYFGEYREELAAASKSSERKKWFRYHVENQKLRSQMINSVYIKSTEKLFDASSGLGYTQTQIKSHLLDAFHTKRPLNEILYHKLVRVVDKEDFRPDIESKFFKINNIRYLNRFKALKHEEKKLESKVAIKAIKIFETHLHYLTTSDYEYNTLLDVITYIIQNPGKKVPYAILITSKYQGIGKSILEIFFRKIFNQYVGILDNSQLGNGYTEFIIDKLIIFVHELYQGDKFNTMNQLKNLITETRIRINEKYVRSYEGTNSVNFIMFSNRPDAVYTDKFDRRLFVIRTEKKPKLQKYYDDLIKVFRNDYEFLYSHLLQRDLKHFNPMERPQETEGKKLMIAQSSSEISLYLKNFLKNPGNSPFACPIVRVSDILEYIDMHGTFAVKKYVGQKAIINFLIEQNFTQENVSIRRKDKGVTSLNVWAREWSKIENKTKIIRGNFLNERKENKKEIF